MTMAIGRVDFFDDASGYGFITADGEDEDVFFHVGDVGEPNLEEGQNVEFDATRIGEGRRATALKRL